MSPCFPVFSNMLTSLGQYEEFTDSHPIQSEILFCIPCTDPLVMEGIVWALRQNLHGQDMVLVIRHSRGAFYSLPKCTRFFQEQRDFK